MPNLTKTQVKHLERIAQHGYVSVSRIDPLAWRKRKSLDDLTIQGVLVKYAISPSYDGYRIAKEAAGHGQ